MNQSIRAQDGLPDDQYPSPHPSPHPHPHPHQAIVGGATSTPTPTPSPPPPPSSPPPASSSTTPLPLPTSSTTTTSPQSPQLQAEHQKTLREAVRNGDSSGLRRLLEAKEGKLNVDVLDSEGQTALHESCQRGNLELVKLLVRFGADVRLANRDGWSPVHIAAYSGHTDILLYLVTASSLACRRS